MKFMMMMIALWLSLYATGCTHTKNVHEWPAAMLNEELVDKAATVQLMNGESFETQEVRVGADSTFLTLFHGDSAFTLTTPTADISSIQISRRGEGAAEGLGLGLLAGAIVGGIVGYASGDDEEGFLSFTADEKAGLGIAAFGALGISIGAVLGASIGSRDRYILNEAGPSVEPIPAKPSGYAQNDDIAASDTVQIIRYSRYEPSSYEGVITSVTRDAIVLRTGGRLIAIPRRTIKKIVRSSDQDDHQNE